MNWQTDKPVFTEDCALVTVDDCITHWDYNLYEIKWSNEYGYRMWLDDMGTEMGDLDDLKADKYLILPKIN